MTTPAEQRRASRAASEGETAARNSSNVAANTAANAGASALLAGLPGPLSGAATALSEGISAAIKASSSQARPVPPTAPPLADPTKLFAAQLALAIITAIWCFIKSILNPLPIIGMFFPLCSDEDRAANRSLLATPTSTQPVEPVQPVTLPTSQQGTDNVSAGITFQEFLSQQQSVPSTFAAPPRQQPPQQQTINAAPAQQVGTGQIGAIVEVSAGSGPKLAQPMSGDDVRKLFGL
jgi:hypothetical protein